MTNSWPNYLLLKTPKGYKKRWPISELTQVRIIPGKGRCVLYLKIVANILNFRKKKDFFVSPFLYFLHWQMYLLYADDGRFLSCFFLKRNAHTNFTSRDCPAQMTSTQFVHWRLMTVLLWKFGTSFLKYVNHIIGFDPLHSTRVEWNLTTWFQTTCYTRNWGWEGI